MPEVVVTAVFRPAEDVREELIARIGAAIPDVHAESGCTLYALHDAEDGTVVFIEKWDTVEDLDAHGDGAPVARLSSSIADLLDEPVVVTRMFARPFGDAAKGAL